MTTKSFFVDVVNQVIESTKDQGYTFKPKAINYITDACIGAAKKYHTEFGKNECKLSASAMTAAAITIVEEKGNKVINVTDVKKGWKEIIQLGPNCPPHRCLKYSVVDRVDNLKDKMPIFKVFLKDNVEK